jgi:hypothetical protein
VVEVFDELHDSTSWCSRRSGRGGGRMTSRVHGNEVHGKGVVITHMIERTGEVGVLLDGLILKLKALFKYLNIKN